MTRFDQILLKLSAGTSYCFFLVALIYFAYSIALVGMHAIGKGELIVLIPILIPLVAGTFSWYLSNTGIKSRVIFVLGVVINPIVIGFEVLFFFFLAAAVAGWVN